MNVREKQVGKKLKEYCKEIERLTVENTSFQKEIERLTMKVTSLLEENNSLKEKIKELEEIIKRKKRKRAYPAKTSVSGKKKKRGRKPGFKGTSRTIPDHVDEVIELTLDACPHCGTPLGKSYEKRKRYVEDIPVVQSHVTKYIIHRYRCPHCKEDVSEIPDTVIPHCRLGTNVMLSVVYQKYALHLSYEKIRNNLETFFGLKTTGPTLYKAVKLIAQYYSGEYEEIKRQTKEAKAVYADETGWRINGVNNWLWVFVTENAALFKIDKRRSSDVPKEVLGEDFDGVLITDFYSAYHTKLPYKKQKCLVHFLRDSKKIAQNNEETKKFHKRVKRFIRDAARFKEENHPQHEIAEAKKRFQRRLTKIIAGPYKDPDCIRLAKRLNQHHDSLLTFLEEDIDYHNNRAERALRLSVIMRKICFGSNSRIGADIHEILMSILTTYKLRKKNFLEESTRFIKSQLRQFAVSQN